MISFSDFGGLSPEIEPHPLMPFGATIDDDKPLVATEWGDVLPPVEFSKYSLDLLLNIANGNVTLFDNPDVTVLAQYLAPKIRFSELTGCWELPLRSQFDKRGRSIYPQITLSTLGYKNQLAHRVTVETLLGTPLPRNIARNKHVDHRCRNHACCNPYHLEVVDIATNIRRGALARRQRIQPTLFQLVSGETITMRDI